MCYNVAFIERKSKEYAERYSKLLAAEAAQRSLEIEFPKYYFVSGFSHPKLPIVKHDGMALYEWGLIPSWAKDQAFAHEIRDKTLNAVGETVFEKASFKHSIVSQRCLLGISGFYEWRDFKKVKYPYFIKHKTNPIFSLGCIYEEWIDKATGEIRHTFSILTTPANALLSKIHNLRNRMPLILSPQDEKNWINPELSQSHIESLIKPYMKSDLVAFTISKEVNNARNERNIPEILEPEEYEELPVI